MKKRLLSIAIAAVMTALILPVTAMADYYETIYEVIDGNIYYQKYNDEITIVNCDSTVTEAEIPSTINEAAVTAIGMNSMAKGAFDSCTSLVSVKIPDSVTDICSGAFSSCKALETVKLGKGITAIPNRMFWCCESLKNIEIPETIESIGENAFQNCYALEKIKIPGTVKSIGEDAFSMDRNLRDIEICEGVETIGEDAFHYCGMESIDIPASVTSIGDAAFFNCGNLKSINVAEDNQYYTSVDGVLFTKDMKELICYPVGKTDESYTIPDGVENIRYKAFAVCTNLKEINLPSSVKSIADYAFYSSNSLSAVNVDPANTVYSSIDGVLLGNNSTKLVFYPSSKADETYKIPAGVTTIGEYAFDFCKNLKTIIIPEGVTTIEDEGFCSCINVETVEIPKSLKSVGSRAFFEWRKLKDIYYTGSEEDWANIDIDDFDNDALNKAQTHYNSKAPVTGYLPGDVNNDGAVNAQDKAILNRYLAGWDGYAAKILNWDAADINVDTKVDAKDKAILNRYLAGWAGYDKYFN